MRHSCADLLDSVISSGRLFLDVIEVVKNYDISEAHRLSGGYKFSVFKTMQEVECVHHVSRLVARGLVCLMLPIWRPEHLKDYAINLTSKIIRRYGLRASPNHELTLSLIAD
jgi:hypothetical protein